MRLAATRSSSNCASPILGDDAVGCAAVVRIGIRRAPATPKIACVTKSRLVALESHFIWRQRLDPLRGLLGPPSAGHSARGLCATPVCQELRNKCVLVARLDRQRRECKGYGERRVVAEPPRRDGTGVRWMGIIDPDSAVHQAAQFRIVGPRLELHEQTVTRWA